MPVYQCQCISTNATSSPGSSWWWRRRHERIAKRLHEKQQDSCLSSAESAKKAKLAYDVRLLLKSSTDETGMDKGCSEQGDLLLTEIEQSLNQDERTDYPVSEKFANIANYCWLQRLSDDQLIDKFEKYNRTAKNSLSLRLTLKFGANLTVRTVDRSQAFPRSRASDKGQPYSGQKY